MKILEAKRLMMDYHNAHSKKKIRSGHMMPHYQNSSRFMEMWKWIVLTPMMHYLS